MGGDILTADGRPGWDDYWLGVAASVAARADCSRRRVGAIIVGTDNRLKGAGYNGAASGEPGCLSGACRRAASNVPPDSSYDNGPGRCIAIHAEMNAIVDAGRERCTGGTIYVTHAPCPGCVRIIAAAGIARTVFGPVV